jgi:hypothetical protein
MKNASLSGEMPKRNVVGRFVEMNSNKIVEVISALFILLFLYTAINKTFEIGTIENVLKEISFTSTYAQEIAWGIILLEFITSLLLFFPKTRKKGLYASLALMIAFTLYIGYMKLFIAHLPCSCGGVISKMTWNQHLIFNILATMLAITALLFQKKNNK